MNVLGENRVDGFLVGSVGYDLQTSCTDAFAGNQVDCVIQAAEDGFSPLGQSRSWLAKSLEIDERELTRWADWVRFESDSPVFVVLRARGPSSRFRGVILSASESSKAYAQFRDQCGTSEQFHRIMACATIHHALSALGARNIGITHLTESGAFREHVAKITVEAYLDLLHAFPPEQPSRLMFCGCCIHERHMEGAKQALACARYLHSRRFPSTRIETVEDQVWIGHPESGPILSQFVPRAESRDRKFLNTQTKLDEVCTALSEVTRTFLEEHHDALDAGPNTQVEQAIRALTVALEAFDAAEQALHSLARKENRGSERGRP